MKKPLNERRRHSILAFELIRLDRTAGEPLHLQLYRQIRDELISGNFDRRSSRLPSSRSLAAGLGVARETVDLAFAKLRAEGYLQSRIGSGTFVADPLPETFLSADKPKAKSKRQPRRPPRLPNGSTRFWIIGIEKTWILVAAGHPVSRFVRGFLRLTNFRWRSGSDSARRSWPRKARIYCDTLPITVTKNCAKRSPLTCAIREVRAVMQIRLSS